MSEYEKIENEIAIRKQLLANTDYVALKYLEGAISEEDFEEKKAQRQTRRDEINDLETQLQEVEA